ncbi:YiaA/YiaB family inner membrane protein [Streptosporangium sp. NPDC051022]|uniref:YiaA/YiaB family inner membrane protein n=1 Tax=Streptosporangium sp. NPDC051022 TaxID=3155752 RepID=UPI0034122236
MTKTIQPRHTGAFYFQSVVSFGVSASAVTVGIVYLPVETWVRAFLGIGVLYVVTSTFTLAKCVRDRQELSDVTNRVDRARLEKLLTEHDPFKTD